MELLPVAEETVTPPTGVVAQVRPRQAVVAAQASGRGHPRLGVYVVRPLRDVRPDLPQAAGQVALVAGVTRHSCVLTRLPLVPGFAHGVARAAETGVLFDKAIGANDPEDTQPDNRYAEQGQP